MIQPKIRIWEIVDRILRKPFYFLKNFLDFKLDTIEKRGIKNRA